MTGDGRRSRFRLRLAGRSDADINGTGHILQNKVRKRHVFESRSRAAMKLDRTTVYLIEQAVGDSDVFRDSAAETEYRPACAERRVGNRHKLATSEQGAGVVLRFDNTIRD